MNREQQGINIIILLADVIKEIEALREIVKLSGTIVRTDRYPWTSDQINVILRAQAYNKSRGGT